jgi:hypothetical protein
MKRTSRCYAAFGAGLLSRHTRPSCGRSIPGYLPILPRACPYDMPRAAPVATAGGPAATEAAWVLRGILRRVILTSARVSSLIFDRLQSRSAQSADAKSGVHAAPAHDASRPVAGAGDHHFGLHTIGILRIEWGGLYGGKERVQTTRQAGRPGRRAVCWSEWPSRLVMERHVSRSDPSRGHPCHGRRHRTPRRVRGMRLCSRGLSLAVLALRCSLPTDAAM